MTVEFSKVEWETYCSDQLTALKPILTKLGYTLDAHQPHIMGERYLTRPLTGGRKLILLGSRIRDGLRVVIKTSDENRAIEELREEHQSRAFLERIGFAYQAFRYPPELLYTRAGSHALLITEFIEQTTPFIDRPIEEQFAIALAAFKTQESAHATTYAHQHASRAHLEVMTSDTYLEKIQQYAQDTIGLLERGSQSYTMYDQESDRAITELRAGKHVLDQYGNFLTHWDFTPQNFRIRNGELYLLDHGSLRFGNKYESWARFINFMLLYNPQLADALIQYVHDNRTPEEAEALRLMRIFRLMELIRYYASWLARTEGDLHELTLARIAFWTTALSSVLDRTPLPASVRDTYIKTRDSLRSSDEKERQKGLH